MPLRVRAIWNEYFFALFWIRQISVQEIDAVETKGTEGIF
jgi:hypothetical protein